MSASHLGFPIRAALAAGLALLALVFVASPFAGSPQISDWLFRVSTLIMLAVSWNLMANAGLISLGHSAFWGLGSYVGIMTANNVGLPFLGSLAAAFLSGTLLGLFLAVATGRLRGIFFAIATLALSEAMRVAAFMLPDLTGGAVGLFLDQARRPPATFLYVVGALAALASILVAYLISRSRFHFACRAMRNNEAAAQMLGVNPFRYRMALLAISGGMASCGGAINTWYGGYLNPEIGFALQFTILAQIAPILGGIHTLVGPVVGSVAVVGISEASRILLGQEGLSQLVYGIILVAIVLFAPEGLWGAVLSWRRRSAARRNRPGASAPTPAQAAVEGQR